MSYNIHEIASRAGVSKSTVSRVISGNGYTSESTRERVMNVIKELQYKPNAVARAMVSNRTFNIGVIIYRQEFPIASHPFYGVLLDGIIAEAGRKGYSVFVMTDGEMSLRSADYMLEKRVDGLILVSRLRNNVIEYVKKFGVPYLMVNGATDDADVLHLVNRDENGGRLAADYLIGSGHRRIAVLAGPQEHRSHYLRFKGFCAAARERDIRIEESSIFESAASSYEEGYAAIRSNWETFRSGGFTALFATNDTMAMGAMRLLIERGARIPQDLSVMGFDDIPMAAMFVPGLTTISVDKLAMGEQAVSFLDRLIRQDTLSAGDIEYDPKLIVRESTAVKRD